MDIKNRTAIVTGAGSGIGMEVAIDFAKHGCTLVLVGRRENKLADTLSEVQKYTPQSTAEACDVSDKQRVELMVEAVRERYGNIDILINNAGMMTVKLFNELTEEEFDRHMEVNY